MYFVVVYDSEGVVFECFGRGGSDSGSEERIVGRIFSEN